MDFRDSSRMEESEEGILDEPYKPFYSFFGGKPILVKQCVYRYGWWWRWVLIWRVRNNEYDRAVFRERPFFGVLLFDNVSSDARDHAANERSMLLEECKLLWS